MPGLRSRSLPRCCGLRLADPPTMSMCRDLFFFQAEDGIRDYKVTGVQTCALPICPVRILELQLRRADPLSGRIPHPGLGARPRAMAVDAARRHVVRTRIPGQADLSEIGRASCRERV